MKPFVWSVDTVVRKAESHQHRRNSKGLLENANSRDAPARSQKDRPSTESLLIRPAGHPQGRMPPVNDCRPRRPVEMHQGPDRRGSNPGKMRAKESLHFPG